MLSRVAEMSVLARPESASRVRGGVPVTLRSPDGGRLIRRVLRPRVVTEPGEADLVLVTVDRMRLATVLPLLDTLSHQTPVLFMLNHWDLLTELGHRYDEREWLLGFPGQIGGGHDGEGVDVTLFPRGTVLERGRGSRRDLADGVGALLARAGLSVRREARMDDWLAVHWLQQSVTPGALAEAGGYERLLVDRRALTRMARALREGVTVCRARGIRTERIMPAPLLSLPVPLVGRALGKMLAAPSTRRMVESHMAHGLPEWRAGLVEVARTGRRLGVDMPVWWSYEAALGVGPEQPLRP